jgi:hypothetical protein
MEASLPAALVASFCLCHIITFRYIVVLSVQADHRSVKGAYIPQGDYVMEARDNERTNP